MLNPDLYPALEDAEFAAFMDSLGPWGGVSSASAPIAVAVSGGADSLCLAFLARRWRRNVIGLTVDHGLRSTSAEEAHLTIERLAGFDMQCLLLHVVDLAPGSGIAQRARVARYAALKEACMKLGAADLLIAHHLLDQAETIAMRKRAQSRSDGLAGMAGIVDQPDFRLVRPLLQVHPNRLRARLAREGLSWVEDPSNHNRAAERVRIRQALRDDRAQIEHLIKIGHSAAFIRKKNEQTLISEWISSNGFIASQGHVFLPSPVKCSAQLLAHMVRIIAGRVYVPDLMQAQRWLACPKAATWGGVQFVWLKNGLLGEKGKQGWLLVREEAAIGYPLLISGSNQMKRHIWDRRFEITLPSFLSKQKGHADQVWVDKVGDHAPLVRKTFARTGRLRYWPSAAWRVLPALFYNDALVAVPGVNFYIDQKFRDCQVYFQPPQPLFRGELYKVFHNES